MVSHNKRPICQKKLIKIKTKNYGLHITVNPYTICNEYIYINIAILLQCQAPDESRQSFVRPMIIDVNVLK